MTPPAETLFTAAALAVLALSGAAALGWISVARPRLVLYLLLACSPTQFIFIPVADFFASLADVLALFGGAGFAWRLARGDPRSRRALELHVFVGLMVAGYLIGFLVLDHFSRTIVRIPMAVTASVLACELLGERRHLARAIGALIAAAFLDVFYGCYLIAIGQPGHPTRFSGMMGVNFSAMVILSGAAMAFAIFGRSRAPAKLLIPGVLSLAGLATLSKNSLIVLVAAWTTVIWRVMTPANRRLVVTAAGLLGLLALTHGGIRDRVLARVRPEVQLDGVHRTSTDVRVLILRSAWGALAEQPLVGVGYYEFEEYSRTDQEIVRSTAGTGYGTHNTYLEVLVEGGLLAFVPLLLHFLLYARRLGTAWPAVARRHDTIAAAALAGLLVVTISAAVANVLLHYLFWSTCGVALAALEHLRTESRRGEAQPIPAGASSSR